MNSGKKQYGKDQSGKVRTAQGESDGAMAACIADKPTLRGFLGFQKDNDAPAKYSLGQTAERERVMNQSPHKRKVEEQMKKDRDLYRK